MASVSQSKRQKMSEPQGVEDIVPINYKELDIIGTGMFMLLLNNFLKFSITRVSVKYCWLINRMSGNRSFVQA